MKRKLSTVVALASGLASLAVAGLWVRSYWFYDRVYYMTGSLRGSSPAWEWTMRSARGGVELLAAPDPTASETLSRKKWGYASQRGGPLIFHSDSGTIAGRLGFHYAPLVPRLSPSLSAGIVTNAPHWFLFLLFSVYPLSRFPGWWRRRMRARLGLCIGCGYDLRGSSQRCPECGREYFSTATKSTTGNEPPRSEGITGDSK